MTNRGELPAAPPAYIMEDLPWTYPKGYACDDCNNVGFLPDERRCRKCWGTFNRGSQLPPAQPAPMVSPIQTHQGPSQRSRSGAQETGGLAAGIVGLVVGRVVNGRHGGRRHRLRGYAYNGFGAGNTGGFGDGDGNDGMIGPGGRQGCGRGHGRGAHGAGCRRCGGSGCDRCTDGCVIM